MKTCFINTGYWHVISKHCHGKSLYANDYSSSASSCYKNNHALSLVCFKSSEIVYFIGNIPIWYGVKYCIKDRIKELMLSLWKDGYHM